MSAPTPFFMINTTDPSVSTVRHVSKYESQSDTKQSFSHYKKENFTPFSVGKYVYVTIMDYEGEGNYRANGGFFCKIVACTLPTVSFKKTLFYRSLKNFQYNPGQIIVELSDGRTISIFSEAAKIDRNTYYYYVSQPYSVEFIAECRHHHPYNSAEIHKVTLSVRNNYKFSK